MIRRFFAGAAFIFILPAAQVFAQAPSLQWGSDTRAMSQSDCLNRAKFAMGEVGLSVCGTTTSEIAGCGPNVAVLATCFPAGSRAFISVIGASSDPNVAGEFRNRVRSLTMGPAN